MIRPKLYSAPFMLFKGLMFTRKLRPNESIVLDLQSLSLSDGSIHTLFVFYAIDAIWLDETFHVLEIKRDIKPFTLHVKPRTKGRYILETLPYAIPNINIGQRLTITFI